LVEILGEEQAGAGFQVAFEGEGCFGVGEVDGDDESPGAESCRVLYGAAIVIAQARAEVRRAAGRGGFVKFSFRLRSASYGG